MKKEMFLALSIVFFVLTGTGFAYYYFFSGDDTMIDQMTPLPTTDKPLSSYVPQTQGATATSDGQLQVGTNQPSVAEPQLPQPKDFAVYEEYANAESSLYIDTKVGTGEAVAPGDAVAMVYSGYLTDGTLFDQSRPNEENLIEPFVFTIGEGQVISGWEQTIVGMQKGGQRRLVIPSQFGYGPTGQNPIPPNAMLVFDVELVDLQKAQPQGQ